MKTNVLYLITLSMLLFSFSCNNDSENNIEESKKETEIVELGNMTPFLVEVENGMATVGFLQSARPFNINLTGINGNKYFNTLNIAKDKNIPIKIWLFENTDEIAKMEAISDEELKTYRESQIAPIETKENLPVIPNETALNYLFNIVKNAQIPYAYAVDGCYARAHKMRQILVNNGYDCAKLFAYGNLSASNGTCCVSWVYHVAPLVVFRNASGVSEQMVFDPSLFNNPVTVNTWLNACKNTSCYSGASVSSTKITPGSVYYTPPSTTKRSSNFSQFDIPNTKELANSYIYDNNYIKTDCVIAAYSGLSGCSTIPPSTAHCN